MWKLLFTFAAGLVTGVLLDQVVESENSQWKPFIPEADDGE